MLKKGLSGVSNVADGRPESLTDYFQAVADAFDLPSPREVGLEAAREVMSPALLSYVSASRRIDGKRILEALDYSPRYPELRSPLRAIEGRG